MLYTMEITFFLYINSILNRISQKFGREIPKIIFLTLILSNGSLFFHPLLFYLYLQQRFSQNQRQPDRIRINKWCTCLPPQKYSFLHNWSSISVHAILYKKNKTTHHAFLYFTCLAPK